VIVDFFVDLIDQALFLIIELIIQRRWGGKGKGTPNLDGISLLASMGEVSNIFHTFLTSLGMMRSVTTCKKILEKSDEGWVGQFQRKVASRPPDHKIQVCSDNFNPSVEIRVGKDGYYRVVTLNTIYYPLKAPVDIPLTAPLLCKYNPDPIRRLFVGLKDNFLSTYMEGKNIQFDVNRILPKLRECVPVPLMEGRSSSIKDVREKIVTDLLLEQLSCNEDVTSITLDPEIFSILMTLKEEEGFIETHPYIVPMIALFHLRVNTNSS